MLNTTHTPPTTSKSDVIEFDRKTLDQVVLNSAIQLGVIGTIRVANFAGDKILNHYDIRTFNHLNHSECKLLAKYYPKSSCVTKVIKHINNYFIDNLGTVCLLSRAGSYGYVKHTENLNVLTFDMLISSWISFGLGVATTVIDKVNTVARRKLLDQAVSQEAKTIIHGVELPDEDIPVFDEKEVKEAIKTILGKNNNTNFLSMRKEINLDNLHNTKYIIFNNTTNKDHITLTPVRYYKKNPSIN